MMPVVGGGVGRVGVLASSLWFVSVGLTDAEGLRVVSRE